jgi:hypothetical protein
VIYQRRRSRVSVPSGYYRFQGIQNKSTVHGVGEGDFIRLRDEFGNVWRGTAEVMADSTVRYRFRDSKGNSISGVSDSYGIVLRDEHGKTWRGFVD